MQSTLASCRLVALSLVLVLSFPAGTAHAETVPTAARSYSLDEVMRRAATGAPEVVVALSTLRRVRAEQELAKATYLPTLSGRGSAGAIYDNRLVIPDQPRIDSKGVDARGTLAVDWVLLDAARGDAVRAAKAATAAEVESSVSARHQALAAALEIYLSALAAEQQTQDAQTTLERRQSQHEAIAGLVRAGVRPRVDEQRAHIEVLNARALLKTRTLERAAYQAALAAAMGDDPLTQAVPQPLPTTTLFAPTDPRDAVRLAVEHRPEARALAQRVTAKRAELEAAIGARLPTVGVSGTGNVSYFHVLSGQGIEGAQYDVNGAVYLSWAGVDARVWRRGKQARAALEEAEKIFARATFDLRREVVAAHYALATAQARLEQAVAVLAVAGVTREAQNERYRAGLSSLLELLDAEDIEQRARRDRIEADRAYLTAQASLLKACGLIGRLAGP